MGSTNDEQERPVADAAPGGVLHRVARGSAQIFVARIVGNAGFFVAVLILGRGLEPTSRGVFALITTAAQIVSRTASFGASDTVMVFAARWPALRSTLLTNLVLFVGATNIAVGGVLVALAFAVSGPLPSHVTELEVILLAVGAVAGGLAGASDSYLVGCSRIAITSTVSAIMPWVYAAVLGALWAVGALRTDVAMLVWVGFYAVWAAVSLTISTRQAGWSRPDRALLRKSTSFGIRVWPGSLTRLLNYRTDQILLGLMAGPETLGIYAVAVNVSEILLQFPSAAATALVPALAGSPSHARTRRALSVFRVLELIAIATVVVAALAGPIVIPFVFGSPYAAAVAPFLWLIPGTLGFVASDVFASALMTQGAPWLSSLPSIAALLAGFALDLILIPPFGASGAAAAATGAFFAGGTVAFVLFRRLNRVEPEDLRPGRADVQVVLDSWRRLIRRG